MLDPSSACLFIGPGLKDFKLKLFERIAAKIVEAGGSVIRRDFSAVVALPDHIVPIIGGSPELRPAINEWLKRGRPWCYWDRGYFLRVFATDLPRGEDGGYYRWTLNACQMRRIRDVPDDRWASMRQKMKGYPWPWKRDGKHIVVAEPPPTYERFHEIQGWTEKTIAAITQYSDRPIVVRDKEQQQFGRKLHEDLQDAHCLVTHGSNAAVEAVIMGRPVFVHPDSAASLVGLTDLSKIESPIYPDREAWLRSLSYCQYTEKELVDGTLWRLME